MFKTVQVFLWLVVFWGWRENGIISSIWGQILSQILCSF